MMKSTFTVLALVVVVMILTVENASAYLDPGAGSAMLQGLLAGIVALGVVLKLYWHRLLKLLRWRKGDKTDKTKD